MSLSLSSHVVVRVSNNADVRDALHRVGDQARKLAWSARTEGERTACYEIANAIAIALEPEQLTDGDPRSPRELHDWPDGPEIGATPHTPRAKTTAEPDAVTAKPDAAPSTEWTVYVDGACSGNPGPSGLGIVLVGPDGTVHDGYEYLGEATNNIAELTAILRAIELVPAGVAAVVHTDSQYSIGVLTKDWRPKKNLELIARTRSALELRRGWSLRYVRGHAGVKLNERADELARESVSRRASRLPRP